MLLSAALVQAQQHVNQEKGFSADKVYDFQNIDSVNMFNGNLNIRIPIGQEYKTGALSYRFGLTYNSNVWGWHFISEVEPIRGTETGFPVAHVDARSNAGMGWIFSLGRLFPPHSLTNSDLNQSEYWVFESPDGADHSFHGAVHSESYTGEPYYYTRDNSYMRMHWWPLEPDTRREVELADGTVYQFKKLLPGTAEWMVSSSTSAVWRLTQIRDRFANAVTIAYSEDETYEEIWTIVDGPRSHKAWFRRTNTLPYTALLDHVDLETFGGTSVRYDLAYDENVEISRPPKDLTVDEDSNRVYNCATSFLKSLTMPPDASGVRSKYSMTRSPNNESAYDKIRTRNADGVLQGPPNAVLTRLQLPTGGAITWKYGTTSFPGGSSENPARTTSDAVNERSWTNETGADRGTTVYRWFQNDATCQMPCPNAPNLMCGRPDIRQRTAAAMSKVGDGIAVTNISYFSVYVYSATRKGNYCSPNGWHSGEYSLPLTRYEASEFDSNRYLSTELRTGVDLINAAPLSVNGAFPSGHRLRATYVGYEMDSDGSDDSYFAEGRFDLNRRENLRTVVFSDDQGCSSTPGVAEKCHIDTAASNFDAFGHYRLNVTSSNFPDDVARATFTAYPTALDARPDWILNTYTDQCASLLPSGTTTATKCIDLPSPVIAKYDFSSTTGFLNSKRLLAGTTNATTDVLTTYTPDAHGNVKKETFTGGDTLQAGQPSSFELNYDNQYDDTALKSHATTYTNDTTPASTETFDVSTGLLSQTEDPSGRQTKYTWDGLGRLTKVEHPDGGTTDIAYTAATITPDFSNAKVTLTATGTSDSIEQEYTYDALGRMIRETATIPQVDTSGVTTVETVGSDTAYFDSSGSRKSTTVQTLVDDLGAASKTLYENYDPFGNAQTVRAPDNSTSSIVHTGYGSREIKKSALVLTSAGNTTAETVERYDSAGQLVEVVEPNGVSTKYGYDVAGHLTSVDADTDDGTQQRRFDYDRRGFLLSETHPEFGETGNGTVYYQQYDARGHAHRKRFTHATGTAFTSGDAQFSYDAAERLIKVGHVVSDTSTDWLKSFSYSKANSTASFSAGKLESSSRINHIKDPGGADHEVTVTESFTYGDSAGRPTARTTTVETDQTTVQTFAQSMTYDKFGAVRSLTYPTCSPSPCTGSPLATLTHSFKAGTLTAVNGYGELAWSANGLLNKVTHLAADSSHVAGVDTQTPDTTGIARPHVISFSEYCYGPAIATGEPFDATIVPGGSAKLRVAATTGATYQWYRGSRGDVTTPVAGANANEMITPALSSNATFWVRVSDSNCSTDSRTATVTTNANCAGAGIDRDPQDVLIESDTTAQLNVVAHTAGNSEIKYQWYKGLPPSRINPVPGATDSTFTTPSLVVPATYWAEVRISDACVLETAAAHVTICSAPEIVRQPQDQWDLPPQPGQTVTLTTSVIATGEGLTFRWYLNGQLQPDSGSIFSRTYSDTGTHDDVVHCVITNSDSGVPDGCLGTVTSADAHFRVRRCDTGIHVSPSDRQITLFPGRNYTVDLTATSDPGVPTPVYTWFHGFEGSGTAVNLTADGPDGPNQTLLVNHDYDVVWCRVKVGTTCEYSTPRTYVSVFGSCPLPPVAVSPTSARSIVGHPITLAAICDWPTVTYQWYRGPSGDISFPIAGATHATVDVEPSAGELYWCRVTDECGRNHRDTDAVPVSIMFGSVACAPILIDTQPASVNVALGSSVALRVTAHSEVPYTISWYRQGDTTPLYTGSAPFVVTPATSQIYYAELTSTASGCGSKTRSLPALVHINSCASLHITTQPVSVTAAPGEPQTISVAADATAYAWYEGEIGDLSRPVPNGTGASINLARNATTSFWVRMTSSCGQVDSDLARFVVCIPPVVAHAPVGGDIRSGDYFVLAVDTEPGTTCEWHEGSPNVANQPPTEGALVGTTSHLWIHPSNTSSYFAKVRAGECGLTETSPITVTVCTTPDITAQPQDVKTFSGSTVTLSVTATRGNAAPNLVYEWREGTDESVIGTGSTFVTPPITSPRNYWVRVKSGACSVDSRTAAISICELGAAVVGGTGPYNVAANENITISAGGGAPAGSVYTWYRGESGDFANSVSIAGPATLSTTPVAVSATTHYWAKVEYGGCTSRTPTIIVNVCKPQITTQPAGVHINSGASTSLAVIATGSPLTYQWYTGAVGNTSSPVANGTASNIAVQPTTTTSYWVRVSGACSTAGDYVADSAAATVTVCPAPAITTAPAGSSIVRGANASLSVVASGTELTYAWYNTAVGVIGTPVATTSSTIVTPQGTTSYWVRVSDSCGNHMDSSAVTVTVCTTPTISQQPLSQSVFSGGSAQLSVTAAAGQGAPPLSYQWFGGATAAQAVAISGATAATYNTGAVTNQRVYFVRMTSGACSIDSNNATISICALAQNVAGAPDVNSSPGQTVRLQLPSYGPTGLTYNWYQGTSGNTSTLIASSQTANYLDRAPTATTQYWAQVVNGSCVSNTATSTINVCVPVINTQPAAAMMNAGGSATLSVSAAPSGITYQWYAGASGVTTSPVSGATSAQLTVQPATTTSYWCRVTGTCGVSVNSNAATVTVCTAIAQTAISPNGSIVQGQSYTLSVTFTGTSPTIFWYRGAQWDVSSPVAAGASISVSPTSTTTYHARVTDACGNVSVSSVVTVNVCTTPTITQQPVSQSVFSGGSRQLTVAATVGSGAPAPTYQWYLGTSGNTASPASNGTSATLDTGAVTSDRTYWVRVTSGACSADSATATISVCALAANVAGGSPVNIQPGASGRLVLPTYGPTGLTYNWYQGTSGDKTTLLASNQIANYLDRAPSATTQYWAEVVNGSCVSNTATMTIFVCVPAITSQPVGASINAGSSVHIALTAGPSGITYQWYVGAKGDTSAPMAGKTSSSIDVTPSATTSYWCRVTGTCSITTTVDSEAAVVNVCQPPVITQNPSNVTSLANNNASLTVMVTGSGPAYQWYRGASGDTSLPISGATAATLTLNVTTSERYWVRVQNGCGSVNSTAAWISVAPTISAQPVDVYLSSGSHANFSVTASGAYLSYQWYQNSTATTVGTNSNKLLTAPLTSNATFFAYVTSGSAQVSSQSATAHICAGPVVSGPYVSGASCKSISVNVADPNNVCRYEWYRGASGDTSQLVQSGAFTSSLSICPVTTTAQYWVRVVGMDEYSGDPYNNGDCYTDSAAVTVTP